MAATPIPAAALQPVARYRDRGILLAVAAALVMTAHLVDVAQAGGANWPALGVRIAWAASLLVNAVVVLRLRPWMGAVSIASTFIAAGAYLALVLATGGAASPLFAGAYPIAMLLPLLLPERLAWATCAAALLALGALALLVRGGAAPGTLIAWAHVSAGALAVGVFAARAQRRVQLALERQTRARKATLADLSEALQNVRTLSGLLRICMHCKRIRDERGGWERLEAYVATRTDASFSHGLCPDCLERHYPTAIPPPPSKK